MKAGKNPEPRKLLKNFKLFNYSIERVTDLPKPIKKESPLFFEVIAKRKSKKGFKKLSLHQISSLLWHSAKAKQVSVSDSGQILYRSNAASAGAIHPIDILVSLPASLSKRSLFYYDPFSHQLASLVVKKNHWSSFTSNVNTCINLTNATLFWFAAHPVRTEAKYKNPQSLIWRDAGALITLVQLVATGFNISSCPVGTLGEPYFSAMFCKNLISAGGIAIG